MIRRVLGALVAGVIAVTSVTAQVMAPASPTRSPADSSLEARTRAVASQLRCPVCQGLSIEDSPSELSQQMRNVVREQLRAGQSPDDVKRYFVSKYGEWILLSPEPHGVNVLVYALPLLALVGGGAVVFAAVSRWTRAPAAVTADGADGPEPTDR